MSKNPLIGPVTPRVTLTPPVPVNDVQPPVVENAGVGCMNGQEVHDFLRNKTRAGNPLQIEPGDDSLILFEEHFRSLTTTQQHTLYSLSVEMGRDFCRDVLGERKKLLEGDINVFRFPFASVPLADFERINAIWTVMDRVMGKSEGARFVIDEEVDVFMFGMAQSYSFKTSPVIHFTNILELRDPHRNDISTMFAFVLHGRDGIFVRNMHDESRLIKMQGSWIVQRLLSPADHGPRTFEEIVREFNHLQVLAHEWGHVRSYSDPYVADSILNPVFERGGKEYPHPSYERFHDMWEVYAELFGTMDSLLERQSEAFTILSFAYYARNLTSRRKNGRTFAFALIPIFLRNVHFDPESGNVKIDFEGLRRDVDNQKVFFYRQFKMYQELSEEEVEGWIDSERMFMHFMVKSLTGVFGTKSIIDASDKPRVEAVFRDQALAELGLSTFIPWQRIIKDIQEIRENFRFDEFNEGPNGLERKISDRLPNLTHELQTEFAGNALSGHVEQSLGVSGANHITKDGVDAKSLPSFIIDINELMRIERKVDRNASDKKYSERGIREGELEDHFGESYSSMSREEYQRVLVESGYMTKGRELLPNFDGGLEDFIGRKDIWRALRKGGYIDDRGVIQPTFDSKRENFTLPTKFESVRETVFETLRKHVEDINRARLDLLSDDELDALMDQTMAILRKYRRDGNIRKLGIQILDAILE